MNYGSVIYHMLLPTYKNELEKMSEDAKGCIDWEFVEAFEAITDTLYCGGYQSEG